MKSHLMMPAGLFAMLLTAALSTGSRLMFVLALMVVLTVTIALISVVWAAGTIRNSAERFSLQLLKNSSRLRASSVIRIKLAPLLSIV